ncbi:MAG: RNA polymerase sigma factor [Candidatus Dormibacteria bacterium]
MPAPVPALLGASLPRGQEKPFDALFLCEYPRVVAIAGRVIGDAHTAEDVAQEVFADFHRRHDPTAPFAAAWLHAAAVHRGLNHLRGGRRRARRELAQAERDEPSRSTDQRALDPQVLLDRKETRRHVRRVLAAIPRKYATVLALRHSGLSYAEVAAAMGVPAGQVGTLLRRAEIRFCQEMSHDSHD